MKKIIAVLFLACALLGYAQDSSIKPEFQAFSGALVKLKKAKNGYHKFMLQIVAAPWAFKAEGEVAAPGGDPDMLINALFDGDLYAVLAYVPSATSGADGQEYQVGLFDMMLFFEDEPTKIRNLKFSLLRGLPRKPLLPKKRNVRPRWLRKSPRKRRRRRLLLTNATIQT